MVVFTCNHCGESLPKPKVEKHYSTVCRRSPKSVACVDCLKDFNNEDYTTHTKCLTEEERYAAKGTFKSPLVKKGELKQESWMETIKAVVETASRGRTGHNAIYNLLESSTNVPRKKNKFRNFIKSALARRASDQDIESVWSVIETHTKTNNQNEDTPGNSDNSESIRNSGNKNSTGEDVPRRKKEKSNSLNESVLNDDNLKNEPTVDKKRKNDVLTNDNAAELNIIKGKKHKSKPNKNEVSNDCNITVNNSIENDKPSKKKKKSKSKSHDEDCSNLNGFEQNTNLENVDEFLKKKKKSKINENIVNHNDSLDFNVVINGDESLKKKKKSKINENVTNHDSLDLNVVINENESLKKKKKSKINENIANHNDSLDLNAVINEDEPVKKKKESKTDENIVNNDGSVFNEVANEDEPPKKKRKSKSKSNEEDFSNPNSSVENGDELLKKKKKSKVDENVVNNNDSSVLNEDEPSKKKKKSKQKQKEMTNQSEVNDSMETKKNSHSKNNESLNDSNGGEFSFQNQILEILQSKKNISESKLKKKVLHAFTAATGKEASEKYEKKFYKQLKKANNITIADGSVQLIVDGIVQLN